METTDKPAERVLASKGFARFFEKEKIICVARYPGTKMELGIVQAGKGLYQILAIRDDNEKITAWNLIRSSKSINKAQEILNYADSALLVAHGQVYSVFNTYAKEWYYQDELLK